MWPATLKVALLLAFLVINHADAHTTQSIDAELATIEAELIALRRKATLLKDLRSLITPDSNCIDVDLIVEKSLKDSQLEDPQLVGGGRRPHRRTADTLSSLTSSHITTDPLRGFSRFLVARANTTLSTSVVFMKVLTLANSQKMKKQSGRDKAVPSTNLVLTVSAHGVLLIKNHIGETLASDIADLAPGEIVVSAEAMARKDAMVALVTSQGRLLIHNFSVIRGRRIIAGRNDPMLWKLNEPSDNLIVAFREGVLYRDKHKQHPKKSDPEVEETRAAPSTSDESTATGTLERNKGDEQKLWLVKGEKLTAVGLVPTRSALNIIILGTSSGRIHMLGSNTTVAFSSPQFGDGKTPVAAFLTHISSNVQAAVGNTVYFYSWYRHSSLDFRCVGPLGSTIVSLAQDLNDRFTLYAGTDKGEILTFDTRSSYRHGSDNGVCILRHKLVVVDVTPSEFAPVAVQATLGYMFAAAARSKTVSLVAFNTSGPPFMAPSLIMNHSYALPPCCVAPTDQALPFSLSSLSNGRHAVRTTSNYISLVLPLEHISKDSDPSDSGNTGESCAEGEVNSLLGYETILPIEEPNESMDITWIRGPLLGMSVVGVVLWQVYRRRKGNGGVYGGNGFGVGGMGGMRKGGFGSSAGGGGPIPADIRAQIDRLSRTGPPGGFR